MQPSEVTVGDYLVLIAGWPELSDLYYSQDGKDWVRKRGLCFLGVPFLGLSYRERIANKQI